MALAGLELTETYLFLSLSTRIKGVCQHPWQKTFLKQSFLLNSLESQMDPPLQPPRRVSLCAVLAVLELML